MTRTIVQIPEKKLQALTRLAAQKHTSRAELIRKAVDTFLASHAKPKKSAFGILKKHQNKTVDSLALQRKLRKEWQ